MPWTYHQQTGAFLHDGKTIGTGYSGAGVGKNHPELQAKRNVGPIPRGNYSIGMPYDTVTHGPHVMALKPVGHTAEGRSGFLIHGDNKTHTASEGCIILSRAIRDQISKSHDKSLSVVR